MTKNQLMSIIKAGQEHIKEESPTAIVLPEAVREFYPVSHTELSLIQSGEAIAQFKLIKNQHTAKFLRDPTAESPDFYCSLEHALPPTHRWCLIGYYLDPERLNLILEFFPCDVQPQPTALPGSPSADYIDDQSWHHDYAPLIQRIAVTGHFRAFLERNDESGEYVSRQILKQGKIFCTIVEIESMCKRRRVSYESGSPTMTVRDYHL